MRRKPETNFTTHHVTDKEAPRLTWQGPSSTNSWKGTRVYHRTAMWANGWRPHKCPVTKVWLDQLRPKADKATFALHDMATFRHAEGRILSNIPTEPKCIILKVLILLMRNRLRVGEQTKGHIEILNPLCQLFSKCQGSRRVLPNKRWKIRVFEWNATWENFNSLYVRSV